MSELKIICLTPVKNEAWILDRFLKCASLWADHIVIADQGSEDNSRSIARDYSKVILLDNPSEGYDEQTRQKLLLNAARKIPGPRLFIALDADEIITSYFHKSTEWKTVLQAAPGSIIRFQWVNICPDLRTYWSPNGTLPLGFIDDGSDHHGESIHSPRIPLSNHANEITLKEIKCLHYQYTNWERMKSKHRWYQVWERINHPHRSSIDIYRQYHHMDAIQSEQIKSFNKNWLLEYIKNGIGMTSVNNENVFWYDREVLKFFDRYGTKKFRREAIWDINWEQVATRLGKTTSTLNCKDPRSRYDRYIHMWLRKTQGNSLKLLVRLSQKILRQLGW